MGTVHVDVDTGEIVRLIPLADDDYPRGKKRYQFQGGFVVMGALNVTRIFTLKMGFKGVCLALLMAARMSPKTGIVNCTNQEYAKELETTPNEIARLITKLGKANFLYRAGPRMVIVNPLWCFRGSAADQHLAIEEWYKLKPIGVVPKPERKTA
jgi:hypothetical protein